MNSRLRALALSVLPLLLSSCGDSTSAPVPSRLVIQPVNVSMDALGLTQQFSASMEDKKGRPITGVAVTWTSSNPEVASITSGGLATGLSKGNASIQASAGGLNASTTLTVSQIPAALEKVAGEGQTGALNQTLPLSLEVEVRDSQGNPIAGEPVSFGILAGAGRVQPSTSITNAQGIAMTLWTLGCSNANPQRVRAVAGGMTADFSASADLALPAICDTSVPDGRVTLPFSAELVAVGGAGSLSWELAGGTLPPGLDLSPEGLLAGTPTQAGSFNFQARAGDDLGETATGDFHLRICQAPIALAPGESVTVLASGPDACGTLLPAGDAGDRYRLGVIWSTSNHRDTVNLPTVVVTARKVLPIGVSPRFSPLRVSDPVLENPTGWLEGLPVHFREALAVEAATEAFHSELREREEEMLRAMGPGIKPLPDRRDDRVRTTTSPQRAAPEKLSLYPNPGTTCSATSKATALRLGENEYLAIYQDSAQAQVDSLKITTTLANDLLDYYRDYGKEVIDDYFGGVTDINDDGRIVVFVTPAVTEGTAGWVWSGDFFSNSDCGASNEMELIRLNAGVIRGTLEGNHQAFGTLVHEAKHVSSLYRAFGRFDASGGADSYQPLWVEEGTAEIAAEMSSRLAWAATGGPSLVDMIVRADKYPITREKYGVLLRWVRTIFHFSLQPNGLVATPTGADESHSLYGSGWHFHRWLGDAYGHAAASPKADAFLFLALNDSLTASGAQGIKDLTGMLWNDLMDEYVSALLLNGTDAPQPEWGFTSYDFPDVTNGLLQAPHQPSGIFPWAVNVTGNDTTMVYQSFLSQGNIGPSGLRVYDLTSDGEGLGLEVEVDTTRDPVRITIVRIE